jgi:hypothetical protein
LTGFLIIRPEELYPETGGLRLYLYVILGCLIRYSSPILRELSWNRLSRNPLLFLLLGLLVAVVMSHVSNLRFGQGLSQGLEFAKLVAYFLVVVAAVTTRTRLRWFLAAFLVFTAVQTTLGIAQYYHYIDVAALKQCEQREYNGEDEVVDSYLRLCGCGIYNDPNDLCLLLTAGILVCLNGLLSRGKARRVGWAIPLATFGFALALTKSRGGLLAAAAGLSAYFLTRYGWKRGGAILLLAAPLVFVVFAGRQTRVDLSSSEDTSQGRIQLWSDGLSLLPSNPVFGIGSGEYAENVGLVAHNSYVHSFVELGLFGGSLFLSAFVLALQAVRTTRPAPYLPAHEVKELTGLRQVVIGILASYMMGIYSLSRVYIPPTYLTLAFAVIYLRLAAPRGLRWFVVDGRMIRRVLLIGGAGFAFLKLFVTVFVRFD